MSRKFSYAVGGLGKSLQEDKQIRLEAAARARENIQKAQQASDILEQEYRLKRENKQAEFEMMYGKMKDSGPLAEAMSIFDKLPEDVRPTFEQAYKQAIFQNKPDDATSIVVRADTFTRNKQNQDIELGKEELTPKWKNDYDPVKSLEKDKDTSPLFVYSYPKVGNEPRLTESENRFIKIMSRIGERNVARDGSGEDGVSLGIIDIDNPEVLDTAAKQLVAATNFIKDWSNKEYEVNRQRRRNFDKERRLADQYIENAFKTFDEYGIDIVSPEFDDILTPNETAIIKEMAKEGIIGISSSPDKTKPAEPNVSATPIDKLEDRSYSVTSPSGVEYWAGKQVKRNGEVYTLTKEDIDALRQSAK